MNPLFDDVGYLNGIAQTYRPKILSDDQEIAYRKCIDFMNSPNKEFIIGGVAGSGKSSIIPYISDYYANHFDGAVAICAPTGKAVMVLKRKGLDAITLHAFLYEAVVNVDEHGEKHVEFKRRNEICFDYVGLLIVDESSMISGEIYSFIKRLPFKTIYIGDHYQLPPVNDDFNIMLHPNFKMEHILRQNEDNPIIMLSQMARNGKELPLGIFGNSKVTRTFDKNALVNFNEVITWTNSCKDSINDAIREKLGYEHGIPHLEDKMIVKMNCISKNVYNGQIVYLFGREPKKMRNGLWEVEFLDELAHDEVFIMAQTDALMKAKATIHASKEQLKAIKMQRFERDYRKRLKNSCIHLDWGYAITCHSAQGSSWKNVALILEDRMKHVMDSEEYNRWIYTGLTRAEESVTVFRGNFKNT